MNRGIVIVADPEAGSRIANAVNSCGWNCESVQIGAAALSLMIRQRPAIVLVHAPKVEHSHTLFCQTFREVRELESVLLVGLTASCDVGGRLRILESGADDCWSDTTDGEALSLRLTQILAQRVTKSSNQVLHRGGIQFDVDAQKVQVNGRPMRLTPKQMKVLQYFFEHPATVLSRKELLQHVWRNPRLQEETVAACISNICRIISRGGHRAPIRRLSSGGYMLE